MAEVREDHGWRERVNAVVRPLLEDRIGPAILADMRAACPIDTGRLVGSLATEMVDDRTLRVGSTDVKYSVWVNEGHRVAYRGRDGETVYTGTVAPPQDFMRPALYRRRGE